ncbi:MAG TPA: polysaccharide deacetylase family protein [Pseudomonadota bacterium]|nr:polysaccharide deacetylase family protein [Pseudomonadota bacterium]HNF96169.1 polysaccharide deacetylase family protein [Pseudomonadota bacterium]
MATHIRSKTVCITIDVEHDCPPFLTTYRGIEEGMPRLLQLFADEQIPATFFSTGDVARRYPETIRNVVAAGHELGSHGDTHKRFGTMDEAEARAELARSGETLRNFAEVTSFRAPNLDFPDRFIPLLAETGYQLDSSKGRHKLGSYFIKPSRVGSIVRIPASISPSPLRTPKPIRELICSLLESPAVLFFHPWEFVDMTKEPLRFDNRLRTGWPAVECLRQTIRYFRAHGFQFHRISEAWAAAC